MATLGAVLDVLARPTGHEPPERSPSLSADEGMDLLARNAADLLGPERAQRSTRIMVTRPSEAAGDDALVGDIVAHGMDIARVNCAHDDAPRWTQMIAHVAAAGEAVGHRCLVAMDLGGPKLRTGPIEAGPKVLRIAPRRDRLGRVQALGHVELVAATAGAPRGTGPMPTIPVEDAGWLQRRHRGEVVEVIDSRGARRRWAITEAHAHRSGGALRGRLGR